ncbi:hypothetical protein P154DRAFT_615144 [Amniculicola lignicola CBS 123094]|uniref:Uncharacterized protein n=1 Tax=Amniculicola lignicola CBS 123094 TaxID=1392246 RepID=A0A6A5WYX2_9PLEO|nr:hypothetical protein P154DRAFT_615144 [Amniculicola lignicola CBS 123094]
MADLERHPTLLALPLELRELIYKEVLANSNNGLQLLRTCREIYQESRKFLYQRPIVFRGQSALYDWLEKTPPEYLLQVAEVSLELEDVDHTPLLNPTKDGSTSPPPPLRSWQLHEEELGRLQDSLSRLAAIKTLHLRALPERQSFLYRDFLAGFLDLLSATSPKLTALGLSGNFHHQSLAFLASLPFLESFSYDGFSALSAADTAKKLAELPNLTRLELISHYEVLQPNDYRLSKFTAETQSFTGEVLSTIERLTSFSLDERTHPESSAILFFTPDILASLHTHKALRNLAIRLAKAPEPETLDALEEYLERAELRRLELDWPDLDPQVFDTHTLILDGLRDLWVRVGSMDASFDILYPILDCREEGELGELERVVLVRDEEWEIGEGTQGSSVAEGTQGSTAAEGGSDGKAEKEEKEAREKEVDEEDVSGENTEGVTEETESEGNEGKEEEIPEKDTKNVEVEESEWKEEKTESEPNEGNEEQSSERVPEEAKDKTTEDNSEENVSAKRMDSANEELEEDDDEDDSSEGNVELVVQLLEKLGVRVSWCTNTRQV